LGFSETREGAPSGALYILTEIALGAIMLALAG
jgi:hypothetical protein